ncbi:MAG: COG1361 S-layer family protein [Methermicoccaceae archaeon]
MVSSRAANGVMLAIVAAVLVVALLPVPAHAQTLTGLSVDVQKYTPYPASAGGYLDVWVKVENMGISRTEGLEIRIEPSYPISLVQGESGYRYIGVLSAGDAAIERVRMVVAQSAPDGDVPLRIYYRTKVDTAWSYVEPKITVGSEMLNSRGTVVLTSYKLYPETLMAGDEGRLDVVLSNTATQRTVSIGGNVYSLDARIQRAELEGTREVMVESPIYRGVGVLAPQDSITLSYTFKVNGSAKQGTYLLNLSVVAGSKAYSTTWRIPIKIEAQEPMLIQSKQGTITGSSGSVEVEVANVRDGTLEAVSIVPESDVLGFEPAEYFVGELNPNELYTAQFELYPKKKLAVGESVPITLRVRYSNGDNPHVSHPITLYITVKPQPSGGGAVWLVVVAAIGGAGVLWWRRRKGQR